MNSAIRRPTYRRAEQYFTARREYLLPLMADLTEINCNQLLGVFRSLAIPTEVKGVKLSLVRPWFAGTSRLSLTAIPKGTC
jgi:hypothetical protein